MDRTDGLELLKANEWLNGLEEAVRQRLLAVCRIRDYPADQRLHSKHDQADGLYGVLQGEVRVSATTTAGDEIVFTRIQSGSWFGEIAILDGGLRTHDAVTTVSSTLVLLPKAPLLQICQQNTDVYVALVKLLCEHCRTAFSAIDDFLLFTPEQRMARQIVNRLESGTSRIPITQQELGALVGISRQSTNKILKSWEHKGWVRRVYRGLELVDQEALKQWAGSV